MLCLCEVQGEKVGVTLLSGYVKGPGYVTKLNGEAEGKKANLQLQDAVAEIWEIIFPALYLFAIVSGLLGFFCLGFFCCRCWVCLMRVFYFCHVIFWFFFFFNYQNSQLAFLTCLHKYL